MTNRFYSLKKQTLFLFSCLLLILFISINSLSLFNPNSQSTQQIFNNFLGSLNTFAQESGIDQQNELLNQSKSGFTTPVLPANILPDYSINFSCNYVDKDEQTGKEYRIIEFNYTNRTDYRINLDRSTVRVGNIASLTSETNSKSKTYIDIDPYSIRDEKKIKELSDNGISIIQTHFNSNLFVREVDGAFEYKKFDTQADLDATNSQITADFEANKSLVLDSQIDQDPNLINQTTPSLFSPAYNNGPIDYLESGKNQVFSLKVPKNSTVVWTAGLRGKTKTTTASLNNIKKCKNPEVADNATKLEDLIQNKTDSVDKSQVTVSDIGIGIPEQNKSQKDEISSNLEQNNTEKENLNQNQNAQQTSNQSTDLIEPIKDINDDLTTNLTQSPPLLTPQANTDITLIKSLKDGRYFQRGFSTTESELGLSGNYIKDYILQQFSFGDGNFLNGTQCLHVVNTILTFYPCSQSDSKWSFEADKIRYNGNSGFCLGDNEFGEIFLTFCDVVIANINTSYQLTPPFDPNPAPNPNPEIDPQPNPEPLPIDPDILEVENLITEYENSIVDLNQIKNTDYELNLSPSSDSVWSLIKDFPTSFTNQTNDFVNGDFRLDCGSFGFVCKNTFDAKTANLIQIIVKFLEGLYAGIGTVVTDIVDLIKSLWSIKDNLSGIGSMISNLFSVPNAITNLFLDSIKDLINSDILTKVKTVGRIIGEKLKDTIIGILTGGAGLAAKLTQTLLKVVDNVIDTTKNTTKGLNIADRFVDSTIALTPKISGKIKTGGKLAGSDLSKGISKLDDTEFQKVLDKITDGAEKSKLVRRRKLLKDCLSASSDCIFGSRVGKGLEQHFIDHKPEFGNITLEEYLDLSFKALLEKPSNNILIKYTSSSKTLRKYNVAENTIISYKDGKILTYFKPDKKLEYWNKPENGRIINLGY